MTRSHGVDLAESYPRCLLSYLIGHCTVRSNPARSHELRPHSHSKNGV